MTEFGPFTVGSIMINKKESQELLGKAALFEDTFSIDWLLELTELKATKILSILDQQTQNGELIEKSSGLFSFSDDKQRRQYFDRFDSQQKEQLHKRAIDILTKEPLKEDDKTLFLARHRLQITNDIDGCYWLVRAGDMFAEQVKFSEAVECYTKAITDLSRNHQQEADRLFIETVNKYMNMFSIRSESEWTMSILENALSRAATIKDQTFLCVLNLHMAINQWQRTNSAKALKHFQKGWSLAQQVEEPRLLKSIQTIGAYFYYLQGRFGDAIRTYEKSVQNVENFPEDTSQLYAVAAIGRSYAAIGQPSQGLGLLDAIRKHCLKIKQHQVAGWAVLQMAYILKGIGRVEDAYQLIAGLKSEAFNPSDIRYQEDLALLQAMLYYWKRDYEKSADHLRNYVQIIKENEALGMPIASYGYVLKLCWEMERGNYPKIEDLKLEQVIEHPIKSEHVFYKGYGYRYKALMARKRGASSKEVLKNLKLSLRWLEESEHRLPIARTRVELARHFMEQGDEENARKEAKEAANTLLSNRELPFPDDLKILIQDLNLKDNLLEEILKLTQEITTIRNTEDIGKHIILTAIQIMGAERGAIFLFKKDTDYSDFVLGAAINLTAEDVGHPNFSQPTKIIKEVAVSGKGVIKTMTRSAGQIKYRPATRSCICVPMIIKNELKGVLYFDNRFLSSVFKDSDLEIFTYFASQAAIAMDNAEAYDEVRRLNYKLNNEKQYYKERQLARLHFDNIVGESPGIKTVFKKVMQVANTDTTVLILGETGVGKELIAGTLMQKSARSEKPYIRVNCSAFSESLIASELFGHEKGSFTGADGQRAGRFELADGGTLFLDEVGDIPMEVQVRLLRVLQTKEFERVGGSTTLRSDFRLITATNQNLPKLVRAGKFREDLFYRLNVFPIQVPPLKKREADIPILADYFLKVFSKKMGKSLTHIPDSEMQKLLAYQWPGNVRELQHIIERGVIMSSKSKFRVPELKTENQNPSINISDLTLAENEKQHILQTLKKTAWKISGPGGAAELLDINYGTLRSRIKKHGIARPR
jgi:formate hydrogenlyase transcriptional activator